MLIRMRNTSSQVGKVVWIALMMACILIGALPKLALASGGPPTVPLLPPTNLVAKLGTDSVTLQWKPSITQNIEYYKVYQFITHDDGSNTVKVNKVSKGSLNGLVSYLVGINDGETLYEFIVTTVKSGIESSPSIVVSVNLP